MPSVSESLRALLRALQLDAPLFEFPGKVEAHLLNPLLREQPVTRLKNQVNERTLKAVIENNAVKKGVHPANARALADALNYKSANQVRHALQKAMHWLRQSIGNRKYGYFIFEPLKMKADGPKYASQTWLAPTTIETIGRWPAITFDESMTPGIVARAVKAGVLNYVMLDDATYSGEQLVRGISTFEELAEKVHKLTGKKIRLFVAVGFANPAVHTDLKQYFNYSYAFELNFYSAGTVKPLGNLSNKWIPWSPKTMTAYVYGNSPYMSIGNNNTRKSLTVLAHKVPNFVSIPDAISHVLSKRIKTPYKSIRALPNITAVPNTVSVHETHRKYTFPNGRTQKLRNAGGKLR